MSDKSIIFFLSSAIIFLIAVIVYQRFVFNKGTNGTDLTPLFFGPR